MGTSRKLPCYQALMEAATDARRLIVLDLDGTITRSDTLIPFLAGWFVRHPRLRLRLARVPLDSLRFVTGCIGATKFKESLLTAFIGGLAVETVDLWARRFASRVVESDCRPEIVSMIKQCQGRGDRVMVLSASPEIYVRPIAENLGIRETIATRVEVMNNRYTGRLIGQNCKGAEKLRRLKRYLAAGERFAGLTVAVGNGKDDRFVLGWADEGWMVKGKEFLRVTHI